MDFSLWLALFLAAWAISISPGPGAVASMAAGLRYGMWPGAALVCGLITGYTIQFIISVVGVAAVIKTSPLLFEVIKWVGVSYLIYLGIKQYRSPVSMIRVDVSTMPSATAGKLFMQGLLVDITNPKAAIFLLAVIPQFVDTTRPLMLQYVLICLTLCLVDLVIMLCYVALAANLVKLLKNPHLTARINKIFGVCFILAALSMAFMNI
ncbi:Homoserine/homoserine lactone efflux protein [Oligella ureolytica]|uniref:Homoserine/homoserine lactone efflux protein n=1 Tax=Oligella ureolytica TaxID=90244 RepID=A0A378XFJ7_9BURK|nr:LysE family transporter [Oligella ureolytica]QPT39073.1 LysE family transporter [Oligella ureolytica]SUA54709.1 Homoserine/homoserine lactone efflux protein [Oligella ureolytica]SUA55826.1 Homoserine/homoserine lactone efflux protein [Oligella ureolytica]